MLQTELSLLGSEAQTNNLAQVLHEIVSEFIDRIMHTEYRIAN